MADKKKATALANLSGQIQPHDDANAAKTFFRKCKINYLLKRSFTPK